ncbi:hypothetical protein J437_LFUL009747 [Ladona fulva]|uniref:inositol-polyphosphate 5-phosphatase n=1 Tax=Ladona fulva TaxID=123851 RepID=A0A8K0K8M3_LADFU|nr:hypothetical protein J437_LFUL009747 [Ladona fulva]
MQPSVMLKVWTKEFLGTVARLDPKFVALHCQEVGGKNYERSMKHVEHFVRLLMASEELRLFDKVRVYLDEDFSSVEKFTALGNFYFIHESVNDILIWDFQASNFVPVLGKEFHSGNIEDVPTKEKAKFPQEFFPELKWSRKGFLRTRWSLNGTVYDLVNIHLFHDASNFVAMESFPSVYSKNRRRALEYTLERFQNDKYESVPFFLFGDFNFRTDTQGVVKVVLSLGKKEFRHSNHQDVFVGADSQWLKGFDLELEPFKASIFEFPVSFPPSYPFEEEQNAKEDGTNGGTNDVEAGAGTRYMHTRCPSWCDRVLMSPIAKSIICQASDDYPLEYGVIGKNACMGDHKPVFLRFRMLMGAGVPAFRSGSKGPYITIDAKKSCPVNSSRGDIVSNTITRYIHIKHSDSPVRIFKETTV